MLPRFAITSLFGLGALIVSIGWWVGTDIRSFLMDDRALRDQPWRLLLSTLPHVDPVHLFFNLYWLWSLGTIVEYVWGHARTLALFVLLGASASAAEFAFSVGGVGLSGIGYGLFGFFWALNKSERFRMVVDRRTVWVFVMWFFLCIVMTQLKFMNVGNIAHGAGLVVGWTVGRAVLGKKRAAWAGLTAALALACITSAAFIRPAFLPRVVARQLAARAVEDDRHGDLRSAIDRVERSLRLDPSDPDTWRMLAAWRYKLGEMEETFAALLKWREGVENPDPEVLTALSEIGESLGRERVGKGDLGGALNYFDQVARANPTRSETWHERAVAFSAFGLHRAAAAAMRKAEALSSGGEGTGGIGVSSAIDK